MDDWFEREQTFRPPHRNGHKWSGAVRSDWNDAGAHHVCGGERVELEIMIDFLCVGVAQSDGRYEGHAPTARRQGKRVVALHAEGLGASAIAPAVGIRRVSVYRVLAEARA